jgi:GDP-L-fucose synthase
MAPQPLKEEYLLSGPLEVTNEWYAVAKIAGIKLCQAYHQQHGCRFISAMPTNLYGPGDNFDLEKAHVLPALIRKFHEAKGSGAPTVTIWGSGTPLREFCHVDDCADACLFLMDNYESPEIVNIGVGEDISIRDLALLVKAAVGYEGELTFDRSKPDGTPRKLVDPSRLLALGWKPIIPLADGIRTTYEWFLQNAEHARLKVG